LLAALLIALKGNGTTNKKLKKYQLSGVTNLSGDNQAVYKSLFQAGFEVRDKYMYGGEIWPTIRTLESDLIPPFTKDALWEKRGRIDWRLQQTGTATPTVITKAYVGKSGNPAKVGSFILLYDMYRSTDGTYYTPAGATQEFSIWFRENDFDLPPTISEAALIKNGWREVVSYTGKDQRKQLNR
jgi:hypothetical protein